MRRIRRSAEYQDEAGELRCADLVLDKETFRVFRGDREIALTPKEFSLLAYLMRHPGKVLSKTRILDNVWGYDSDPLTNVVEVYIRHLRQKIDGSEGPSLIHTVRGFGYKIDGPPPRQTEPNKVD